MPGDTPVEIVPGLWLGTVADAKGWKGTAICVLEELPDECDLSVVHVPISDTSDPNETHAIPE
jgi:hypothetical protein